MADETSDAREGAGGTGADVFAQMGEELADAMRREVEQVRTELGERLHGAAKGARLLAAAGASGAIAGAAAGTLPLMALRRVVPSWLLAVLVAGGAGALAARFARQGLEELGDAAPIDAERVKDAAKDAVRSTGR